MNTEKLISEVLKRECLWNQAHPDHHNRYVLERKWGEVSAILNSTKDATKCKWKYLRDTFRKELAKSTKPRSGDEAGTAVTPKWCYFNNLLFLKDQFTPRQSTSNLPTTSSCATQKSSNVEDEVEVNNQQFQGDSEETQSSISSDYSHEYDSQVDHESPSIQSSTSIINEPSSEPTVVLPNRKRKKSVDLIGQALLNVEREKLKLLQNKDQKNQPMDEDRCFFESILPHIKKLEPLKKLELRCKIQELVILYAYGNNSQPIASTSTTTFSSPTPNNSFDYQPQW